MATQVLQAEKVLKGWPLIKKCLLSGISWIKSQPQQIRAWASPQIQAMSKSKHSFLGEFIPKVQGMLTSALLRT